MGKRDKLSRTPGIFKLVPSGRKERMLRELKREFRELSKFVIDTYVDEIQDEIQEDGKKCSRTLLFRNFKRGGSEYDLVERSDLINNRTMLEGMLEKIAVTIKNWEEGDTEKPNKVDCLHFRTRIVWFKQTEKGYWGIYMKHPDKNEEKEFIKLAESDYNNDGKIEEIIEAGSDDEDSFTCEIIEDDGEWYLHAQASLIDEVDFPDREEVEHIIGVDTGIKNTATCYVMDRDGNKKEIEFFKGVPLSEKKELDSKLSYLQRKGHKDAFNRWKDKKGDKIDYQNHVVSKKIVELADEYKPCLIVFEDLEGSKEDMGVGKYKDTGEIKGKSGRFKNRLRSNWSPHDLIQKTTYKAEEEGIEVIDVYPRGTSSNCPECGEKGVRNQGKYFRCVNDDCDFTELNDDLVGAMNIAKRGDKKISA